MKTKVEAIRDGYIVLRPGRKADGFAEYRAACFRERRPQVVIRQRRGIAWVEIEMDRVGYPCNTDATLDIKIHAILGQSSSDDVVTGRSQFSGTNFYAGRVKTDDPDAVGAALAAVLDEGLPYAWVWNGEDDDQGPPRREPDWPALAAFYASHVWHEPTVRAIRMGYWRHDGLKTPDPFDYRAYCDLAELPVIVCWVSRGRAMVTFEPSLRIKDREFMPPEVGAYALQHLESIMGREEMEADGVHFCAGRPGGVSGLHGVPREHAESVASALADVAHRVNRSKS